jgi:hypothetical protein
MFFSSLFTAEYLRTHRDCYHHVEHVLFVFYLCLFRLASLLRPWLTTSSSSDSESSTRLHHSSYLMTLLISSSILSGPTFPIVFFSRNLSKGFSHRGFPSRAPIDHGRMKAPVVGSVHTSRRASSKAGQRSRTCVLVIVGGCTLSYLSSKNQHPAWARLPISLRYTPESQ